MMSECMPKADAGDAQRRHLLGQHHGEWPKSPPPPPYSVGSVTHSRPSRPALQPDLAVDPAGLVPFGHVRSDLALQETAHRGAELLVIVSEYGARDLHWGSPVWLC